MNSSWISEFGSKDAKLLILVGSIKNDLLLSELNSYPCGVLWIGPREVARSSVKTNLLKVDPKEDFDKLALENLFSSKILIFLLITKPSFNISLYVFP